MYHSCDSIFALVDQVILLMSSLFFFFFNDTATTEIYTLSLHDALPIWCCCRTLPACRRWSISPRCATASCGRSEEHTSELQSRLHLVCRLLLEKKKKIYIIGKTISICQ